MSEKIPRSLIEKVSLDGTESPERQAELEFLATEFEAALAVVENLDEVNARIAASSRPDLPLTDPAPMMEAGLKLKHTNNFTSYCARFGIPLWGPKERRDSRNRPYMSEGFIGRRLPTEDERTMMLALGGGDTEALETVAMERGIRFDCALEITGGSNAGKEAFIRMAMLFPELTHYLTVKCFTDMFASWDDEPRQELYVTYQLMSKLVDKNDKYVMRNSEPYA